MSPLLCPYDTREVFVNAQVQSTMMKAFHISRQARDRYEFDQSLFQFTGNAVLSNLQAARAFAQRMNDRRDIAQYPDRFVAAGDVNAMGLIDELSHMVVKLYDDEMRRRKGTERRIFSEALNYASEKLGAEMVLNTLSQFTEAFPPLAVYRGQQSAIKYLSTNSVDALEEQLMLWLENNNPAFTRFSELFDDAALKENTAYEQVISTLKEFFDKQPAFGPDNQTLIEMLRAPALASPDSLEGQLRFIQERWTPYFGETFARVVLQLLTSLDLIKEDQKAALSFGWVGDGNPQSFVPSKEDLRTGNVMPGGQDITIHEYEAYTPDREWMPRLVLLAKNTYVWLDQLSRKYERAITKLSDVPDEELDLLAKWGFTGLWLIGLWERSTASQRIKQMMGAQDAVASAYSLYEYRIAEDLGGPAACEDLKQRAKMRGIRLASDMVPNHMGIDSKWVIERPDYFLSVDQPPFPAYTFTGPDLSSDERVGIFLEDHYYTKNDAAVVFKRLDKYTGDARYIYHGNDGTAMPWNDTAQLNFLKAEVREAVMQVILDVAKQFPVIRFDAAMVLAKRHIRRLWFPEPGAGGAIPSRAGQGMSAEDFEALLPNEFWREVVDRAAVEIPDTLLLAEAFWMLEGYFVRTLGMHRVYNSAFMNMLRDEKNDEYRQLIKNTVEFDPEILRRYVNFLNNPDEKTAVEQFGKGDKYFGVTTMMCTMPGLPMLGHGQIEGYSEKYGMEFRYPKLWEWPDNDLVKRHERDIFPLMKKRYLFAGVDHFRLFDFWLGDGSVNEDVFAYSNRFTSSTLRQAQGSEERALVIYHNKFAEAKGWIRSSVGYIDKAIDSKALQQTTLGDALGLHHDDNTFTIFHDLATGQEFIRSSKDLCERGMYVELGAYKCHVFMDIREVVSDAEHPYAELNMRLDGRGVPSIERELTLMQVAPITRSFKHLINGETLRQLLDATQMKAGVKTTRARAELANELAAKAGTLLIQIQHHLGASARQILVVEDIRDDLIAAFNLSKATAQTATGISTSDEATWSTLFAWLLLHRMGQAKLNSDATDNVKQWMEEWQWMDALKDALMAAGLSESDAWQASRQARLMPHRALLNVMIPKPARGKKASLASTPAVNLAPLFDDPHAATLLQINAHDGATWFNKETYDGLMKALAFTTAFDALVDVEKTPAQQTAAMKAARAAALQAMQQAEAAGYQVESLLPVAVEAS
jgi:glycosidase